MNEVLEVLQAIWLVVCIVRAVWEMWLEYKHQRMTKEE